MREEAICEHVAPAPGKGDGSAKDGSAKRFPFHPYVFGTAPILMLYVHNIHKTPFSDVPVPLVVALGVALITVFVFRLVFAVKERAAIAASYVLALTLLYAPLKTTAMFLMSDWGSYFRHRYALAAWFAAMIVGLLYLRRAKFDDRKATYLVNTVSIMLIFT